MPDATRPAADTALTDFIARWQASSAAERANYQLYLTELCDVLGVPRPEPSQGDDSRNTYVFERAVTFRHPDGSTSSGRIDLYRRGCFVLEAKQGSEVPQPDPDGLLTAVRPRTRRGTAVRGTTGWDEAMLAARGQAEQYVRALPDDNPPFIVVVDVGHSIELYSDFSRLGKTYTPFPDARSHRLFLRDLSNPELLERLRLVWTEPLTLDPARRTAKVTREIAAKLADLARSLERTAGDAEAVATFLMRCLFTLFAEDVGLIPRHAFTEMLKSLRTEPAKFPRMAQAVWRDMDTGGFSPVLREDLLRFNGGLFADTDALPLSAPQLQLLIDAAEADWKEVEPAIFGTLLERALDPVERHKLGAHYTPRAYVERLVLPTIIEPLREEWSAAQTAAVTLARAGKRKEAIAEIEGFLRHLCEVIVLDPACGSGNFLYVTLEHMKRLEGEVRDALLQLGEGQELMERVGLTVDPHQLRGIELNPRAAAIADLVLWIGYLQWHFRTHGETMPAEPVLKKFDNIECRDAVLAYDRKEYVKQPDGRPLTRWDGRTTKKHAVTGEDVPDETARVPVFEYINPRKAEWPKADYVVGNPPFIGTKRMKLSLGEGYVETLRSTYSDEVEDNADYVMYWWNAAANLLEAHKLHRFGLISTNSLAYSFNRRVVQRHLDRGVNMIWVIPDHPWTDEETGAAVRIAMTVACESDESQAQLASIINEGIDTEELQYRTVQKINADLRSGAAVSISRSLTANRGVAGFGAALHGAGFVLTPEQAVGFRRTGEGAIRRYIGGRDLAQIARELYVIDFSFLSQAEARLLNPAAFQWVIDHVKPERDLNNRKSIRENWWRFGWERPLLRNALKGLTRFIATTETSKHRVFQFVSTEFLPDHMVISVAIDDALALGTLSSRIHVVWSLAAGGRLGVGNDPRYNTTRCFDPFPFPACNEAQKQRIRELGEQLDAHRKRQQAAHAGLTITDMYNVLAKLRSGEELTAKDKRVHEQGLVSVLRQIHDDLDTAVFDAYGWPADLSDEQILERLVALNAERAAEEARGLVRWLRPEFQNPQGGAGEQQRLALPEEEDDSREGIPADVGARRDSRTSGRGGGGGGGSSGGGKRPTAGRGGKAGKEKIKKQPWPATLAEQARALRAVLAACSGPAGVDDLAKRFLRARRERIDELLDTLVSLGQAREVEEGKFVATG